MGFGSSQNQSQSTPMSPMHSGNEIVDNTLASLASVTLFVIYKGKLKTYTYYISILVNVN